MDIERPDGGAVFQHVGQEAGRYRDSDHFGDFREGGDGGVRLEAENFVGFGVDGINLALIAELEEIGDELARRVTPAGTFRRGDSGGADYGYGLGVERLGEVGAEGGYGLNESLSL